MNDDHRDIEQFLESGLLEEYLLGLLDAEQSAEVERMIDNSDLVKAEWEALQVTLETVTMANAIHAPAKVKASVMSAIAADKSIPRRQPITSVGNDTTPAHSRTATIRRMNRMVVAASVAAFLFAAIAIVQWLNASRLDAENQQLTQRIEELQEELDGQTRQLASLSSELNSIASPSAQKIVLQGNDNAPDLKLVAYWDKQQGQSFLRIVDQPKLANEQCFQLWADVHGEMVSLGVIPKNEDGLVSLDFKLDAESLNVTIEPKGGSEHPTVSRLVASQVI